MPVITATYSGRFMRPSSFKQETPMASASSRRFARQLSLRLRGRWLPGTGFPAAGGGASSTGQRVLPPSARVALAAAGSASQDERGTTS